MAHQQVFPIDIFESVIDQASDHASSLRQFSLICRALHPRARYHLFSSISIRSVEQVYSAAEFLDTHPWIPPLVRKVSLSPGPLSSDHKKNVPLLDIVPVHVLSRLPNLLTWKLKFIGYKTLTNGPWLSFHRCALLCYHIYCGRIRNLELSCLPFNGMSHFTGLLSAFTAIHTVICSNIQFRIEAERKPFVCRTLARPLNISRLHVGDWVDFRAVGYLLASSGTTLNNLVLTLGEDTTIHDFDIQKWGMQTIRFRQLSSLTLVLSCHHNYWTANDPSPHLSRYIIYLIRTLELVERPHMCNVRVEFTLYASNLGLVGAGLSRPSEMFMACQHLGEILLTFRLGRMSFYGSAAYRREGRAAFWSPVFKSAFPRLDERGLLVLNAGALNADVRDPVGHEGPVNVMAASYDSKWIATGSADGVIIVWDTERGTITQEWVAHRGFSVGALCFSPGGESLVSAARSYKSVMVWCIGVDGVYEAATLVGHTRDIISCAWSPDSALIASASNDNTIRIWDALTFEQHQMYDHGRSWSVLYPGYLTFSPDSQYLAWISRSSTDSIGCSIWRPLGGEPPKWFSSGRHFRFTPLSFDPESKRVATTQNSQSKADPAVVKIWDTATGAMLAVLAGHSQAIGTVSFSPDGRSILSASLDGWAKIWDIESGAETATLHVHKDTRSMRASATVACFSPDGKFIATVGHSFTTVKLWRTDNAMCVVEFIGHRGAVISHVVFSPNGEFLASADEYGIVVFHRVPSSLR